MAQLGVRRFDDLIGRADLLDTRKGVAHWKAQGLDFSRVLALAPPRPMCRAAMWTCKRTGWTRPWTSSSSPKRRPGIGPRPAVSIMRGGPQRQPLGRRHALRRAHPRHPDGLPDGTFRRSSSRARAGSRSAPSCARGITLI